MTIRGILPVNVWSAASPVRTGLPQHHELRTHLFFRGNCCHGSGSDGIPRSKCSAVDDRSLHCGAFLARYHWRHSAACHRPVPVNKPAHRRHLGIALQGDPVSQANALLAKMNTSEKIAMLHGVVKNYVGNVVGNDRLGIPPLNLNDGPQVSQRGLSCPLPGWFSREPM